MADGKQRKIRSFVLRSGRMSTTQQEALTELAPQYDLSHSSDNSPLKLDTVYAKDQPVIIEIGFGMGEATLELAKRFPHYNFLAIEVHKPGVGKVLHEIEQQGLDNLRVYQGDAVEVMEERIEPRSIAGFHIFFPDPWPKKRHHKRRLIQEPFALLLSRRLRSSGYVYAVTDWEEYAWQMLDVFNDVPELENPYGGFAPPVPWRPQTSFERKGMEKRHPIWEVWYQRK